MQNAKVKIEEKIPNPIFRPTRPATFFILRFAF